MNGMFSKRCGVGKISKRYRVGHGSVPCRPLFWRNRVGYTKLKVFQSRQPPPPPKKCLILSRFSYCTASVTLPLLLPQTSAVLQCLLREAREGRQEAELVRLTNPTCHKKKNLVYNPGSGRVRSGQVIWYETPAEEDLWQKLEVDGTPPQTQPRTRTTVQLKRGEKYYTIWFFWHKHKQTVIPG